MYTASGGDSAEAEKSAPVVQAQVLGRLHTTSGHSSGHTQVMQTVVAHHRPVTLIKKATNIVPTLPGPQPSWRWLSLQVSRNPVNQFVTESRAATLGYLEGLDQFLEGGVATPTVLVLLKGRVPLVTTVS